MLLSLSLFLSLSLSLSLSAWDNDDDDDDTGLLDGPRHTVTYSILVIWSLLSALIWLKCVCGKWWWAAESERIHTHTDDRFICPDRERVSETAAAAAVLPPEGSQSGDRGVSGSQNQSESVQSGCCWSRCPYAVVFANRFRSECPFRSLLQERIAEKSNAAASIQWKWKWCSLICLVFFFFFRWSLSLSLFPLFFPFRFLLLTHKYCWFSSRQCVKCWRCTRDDRLCSIFRPCKWCCSSTCRLL